MTRVEGLRAATRAEHLSEEALELLQRIRRRGGRGSRGGRSSRGSQEWDAFLAEELAYVFLALLLDELLACALRELLHVGRTLGLGSLPVTLSGTST